jgi:hypothetical protein
MLKRLAVAAVGLVVFAIWAVSAGATQGGSTSFGPETIAVPSDCGLGEGVTITLTGKSETSFDESAAGGIHETVTGTATDSLGNTYVFNYHANIKGDPFAATGHFTDHFNLVGNGSSTSMHTGFNLIVTVDGFKFVERGGALTLGCDPI